MNRSDYVTPCGGCVCNHCMNSVECTDKLTRQESLAAVPCFNCDECRWYGGTGKDNWKGECDKCRITDQQAKKLRKRIRIIKSR